MGNKFMELHKEITDYLKTKTNGKLVLTPEQLEFEIGVSAKQQSKLRKENKFPIPYKNIGRNVFYSIFHVADFLLTGEVSSYEPKEEQIINKSKIKPQQSSSQQDFSHLFLLKSFASNLWNEANKMMNLADNLTRYHASKELHDKLNKNMEQKEEFSDGGKV